jgi:hypothetical protein
MALASSISSRKFAEARRKLLCFCQGISPFPSLAALLQIVVFAAVSALCSATGGEL